MVFKSVKTIINSGFGTGFSRERVPDEHIGLQSKIRLKINHWRLSPEPPELAGFYVDSVRECVRKLAAGRRSVRLASNSSAGSGFTRPPGSLERRS